MRKFVYMLGMCLAAVPAQAITVTVPAGTTQTGGHVPSIMTQNVEGTVNNFTVEGTQNIMAGGVSNSTYLYPYAGETVYKDGKAFKTTVSQSAFQSVAGYAEGTTVNSRGRLTVSNGGVVSESVINGGSLLINKGGISEGASVYGGGRSTVYGTDKNTVLYRGAEQLVNDGGTAEGTVINDGALQTVETGALAEGTRINGGEQKIFGTVRNSILNSGSQRVSSGGFLDGADVMNGTLEVSYDSEARNVSMINSHMELEYGGKLSGSTSLKNSSMRIYDDTQIPDLSMDNSLVATSHQGGFVTVEIDNLSGTGQFYMNSDVDAGKSDHLIVKSGDGNYQISLHDYSVGTAFPGKIHLVETADDHENFSLVGGAVDVGPFRYNLNREGDEWVLVRSRVLTDSAQIAKNTYSSISSIFYTHLQSLNQRMGDVRFSDNSGLWISGMGRNIRFNYKDDTKSSVDSEGFQFGADYALRQSFADNWVVGLYGGYTDSRQKFDRSGSADADTYTLGLYSVLWGENGNYFDLAANKYWHRQKIRSYLPDGFEVDGKYNTGGWSISAEIGKKLDIVDGWFAEPQLQLVYMDVDDIDYRTSMNTPVSGSKADFWSGRIGVRAGRDLSGFLELPSEIYLKTGLLRTFTARSKVKVGGHDIHENMADTLWEIGAGFDAEVQDQLKVYFTFTSLWGDRVDMPVDVNLGIRYEF